MPVGARLLRLTSTARRAPTALLAPPSGSLSFTVTHGLVQVTVTPFSRSIEFPEITNCRTLSVPQRTLPKKSALGRTDRSPVISAPTGAQAVARGQGATGC